MSSTPSKSPPSLPDVPSRLPAPPARLVGRLHARLLTIRSLWFPTPRELRAWSASGAPLYVRRLGARRVEVGPRLASMWAACFAPAVGIRLVEDEDGTALHARRRWPGFTRGLMLGWWAVLVAWPLALARLPASEEPERWLVFWAFLVVASTAGPALGWIYGDRALDGSRAWLHTVLQQTEVDEDW